MDKTAAIEILAQLVLDKSVKETKLDPKEAFYQVSLLTKEIEKAVIAKHFGEINNDNIS